MWAGSARGRGRSTGGKDNKLSRDVAELKKEQALLEKVKTDKLSPEELIEHEKLVAKIEKKLEKKEPAS